MVFKKIEFNPLQTLALGLVLTLTLTFGPELDNNIPQNNILLWLNRYIEQILEINIIIMD